MVTIKIKTRESLHTVKTLDKAENLTSKMKNGGSSVYDEASRQVSDDGSERDYGNSELENWSENGPMMAVNAADRFGRWGIRTTTKNIRKWKAKKNVRNFKVKNGQKALNAPKKAGQKMLNAPKTAQKTLKTTQQSAKATAKTAKAAAKAAQKAAQAAKAAIKATIKGIQIAVKAIIAAVKAAIAAIKGIIAAIAAGGWIAVVIILAVCVVALIVGSIFGIFTPSDDDGLSIQSVMVEMNNEYRNSQNELKAEYEYDYCVYDGEQAEWKDMIAVYAVKLNLDAENPQEVATFDEKKAEKMRGIFNDMNSLSAYIEEREVTVTKTEVQSDGSIKTVEETVIRKYLHIVTAPLTANETAEMYVFTDQQKEQLDELLSDEYADMWAALIG